MSKISIKTDKASLSGFVRFRVSTTLQRALLGILRVGAPALAFVYREQLTVETLAAWVVRDESPTRKGLNALALLGVATFRPRLIGKLRERPMLEVEELERRLDAGAQLLVLDLRTRDDFIGEQGSPGRYPKPATGDSRRPLGRTG